MRILLKKKKSLILKENQQLSGIYLFINKINEKKIYREQCGFRNYFSTTYLKNGIKSGKSKIYSALFKYGYKTFL
jgi:hypothetical protein